MSRLCDAARNLTWAQAGGLLVCLVLLLHAPLLVGIDAGTFDADSLFAPAFTLLADHARAGQFLLWNPWTAGGVPDAAEPEFGSFSPPTLLFAALAGGSERGFAGYRIALWLAALLGLLALARHLGTPPAAGFVCAAGFGFSGFFMGHAQHTSWTYAFAFLPLVVWRQDAALLERRFWPACEAGLLFGLSGLAGYPSYLVLSGLFVALWTAGRVWALDPAAGESRGAAAARALAALSLLLAVGLVVLAPTAAALLGEGAGYSDRAGVLDRATAVGDNALEAGALLSVASPYLAVLKEWNSELWPATDGSLCSFHLSAPALVLALCALAFRPRDRWRWWLLGIGGLFLATALRELPLRGWLYEVLPVTRYFRHAAQFKDYATFTLVVLACLGLRDLATPEEPAAPRLRILAWVSALTGFVAVASLAVALATVRDVGPHPIQALVHAGVSWLGLALVAHLARHSIPTRKALPALLLALAAWDAAGAVGLSRPVLSDRHHNRAQWDRIDRLHVPGLELSSWDRTLAPPAWTTPRPNNKNVPLRTPILGGYLALRNRQHDALLRHPAAAALALGPQRTWFAAEWVQAPAHGALFDAWLARAERGAAPLLIHSPAQMMDAAAGPLDPAAATGLAQLAPLQPIAASLDSYRPNLLAFSVDAPQPGWLLVTDRWARGWRAWIDGQPAEVWGGNFLFRALPLTAGRHQIRFRYQPLGFPWLLVVSWSALALGAGVTVWSALRSRRPASHQTAQPQQP